MKRALPLAIVVLTGCSSSTTTTTDDSGTTLDATTDAPVECNLVADDCRSGTRCTEVRVGEACGAMCLDDKGATGTQGMKCSTPADCAKGYACTSVDGAPFSCARYCNDGSVCTLGTKCLPSSKCPIGKWIGGMCR